MFMLIVFIHAVCKCCFEVLRWYTDNIDNTESPDKVMKKKRMCTLWRSQKKSCLCMIIFSLLFSHPISLWPLLCIPTGFSLSSQMLQVRTMLSRLPRLRENWWFAETQMKWVYEVCVYKTKRKVTWVWECQHMNAQNTFVCSCCHWQHLEQVRKNVPET